MTQLAATHAQTTLQTGAAGPAAPPLIKLNTFQLLMRRWSALHPYSAGQVMEVTGPPDRDRWKAAAEAVINQLGLGKPRFSDRERFVQFSPIEDLTIETSQQELATFFNEELNRPFAAGDLPIRFCLLPAPNENAHYFAAVYDHWIADSRAMRELMHRIFDHYAHNPHPEKPAVPSALAPLTLNAPPFNQLYKKHVGLFTRWAAIRESTKNAWRHRHGFRVNMVDPVDFSSGFCIRDLPPGLIEKIYRYAKAKGASVNDVFIAVVAQCMDKTTHKDRTRRRKKLFHFRRQKIGVGTIVDLREAACEPLDHVFNLYLSSYTVLLDEPDSAPVESLLEEVLSVTRRAKKTFATVKQFWAFVMARFLWDSYKSPRFQSQILHKTVPLVAGISNVNMTKTWADCGDKKTALATPSDTPRVLDYLRISPTGPLIPLVFTLTTIRDRLSLCVTYRTTAFNRDEVSTAMDDFVERMEKLVTQTPA